MYFTLRFLVKLFVVLSLADMVTPKFDFTNIKCTSLDTKQNNIEYCLLKAVNRSYKYMSLKVKLYDLPINEFKVNIEVLKRLNGYKPFLFNVTVDGCRFFRYPKSSPVFSYLNGLFRSYSNINHTCPYNHDIVVDKLSTGFVNTQVTEVLPMPVGDYCFQTKWISKGILRAMVSVYGTIS